MGKLPVVFALMAVLAGACTPRSTAATTSPTSSSPPSPTPSAASAVQLCFAAPPADWAAAMKKTVATVKGINFGPGAVDDARGIVYGGFSTAHERGIAAIDLATGKMTVVS